MGKKKAAARGGGRPQLAPSATAAPEVVPSQPDQDSNNLSKPLQNGALQEAGPAASSESLASQVTALQSEVASLATQLAEKSQALEGACDEVAVLRSQCKDRDILISRLQKQVETAMAEAAAECEIAALDRASAVSSRRVNYVLGAATMLSLALAALAALRSRPSA